jgi:hypothetical protein
MDESRDEKKTIVTVAKNQYRISIETASSLGDLYLVVFTKARMTHISGN